MAVISEPHWEKPKVPESPPSKFNPPAMGTPFVARARLTERIRQAAGAKLILVQAPAGFGITTLLRDIYDLFTAAGYAIIWLTLDSGDNDLDRFMTCLSQAFAQLEQISSAFPMALKGRETQGVRDSDSLDLMTSIVSAPLPFMLILDEFEHLHNPAAISVVQQLIELLGPQQKVVIGSREQSMLSLGRLRARQQLLEIDAAQLRFTLDETRQFLCDKRGLLLDNQDVERLHQVTGGWAAALWLSSLALENSDDPKRFIRTFSGSNTVVASYLAEDVLSQKPKHLQDFILQTSILQKFTADSCNAVTGRTDSKELLHEVERSNMFMTALDEEHNWFSYHPLFAGFLRAQLDRQYPGLAATLHRRAADWYISQGRATHAIDHAIASGDKELVLRLLSQHAESLFLKGRVRLLVRWFDRLERSTLVRHPKLVSVYAWALIHINRSAEALNLLETVIDSDGTSPLPHPTYNVLRIFSLVMMDRIEETAPMWDDPHILGSAAQEPFLRSMLMIGCAYYYATIGRFKDARLLLDQATQEQPSVGPLFSISVAGFVRSMLDLAQGNLRAAVARLLALVGDESQIRLRTASVPYGALIGFGTDLLNARQGADSGFACLYLAEVLYEMDSLTEAKRLLKQYLPLVKDAGIPDQLIASHLIHARILHSEDNTNDALQTLLELEQLGMERLLPRVIDIARLEQARMAILDNNLDAARSLLALVGHATPWQRRNLQMIADDIETPLLANARLQIHSGQAANMLPLLKEHLQDAYSRGRLRYALRVKVLYALALSFAGQRNPALRAIRETLQDAMAEGFVRIFKDEGPPLLVLIREMLEGTRDVANSENLALHAFVERILHSPSRDMRITPASLPAAIDMPGNVHAVTENELTSRELDVLMLLAQGYGNQVIAEKLFISVTTVKTHLRNINLKLGAHNRTEAISLARKLCIIS